MLSFVFILAGKGKSSSPGPSVGAVQQASEDGPEASVADPTAGPSAGAVQQASSVSHVLPGAVHGQLVCVDHLSADDRAKTAPMMSKNGGTCVIGGKEVSITWFLVNWDKSSDTAMLKYVKLNRDAKAKGGHRSVVSAQIWHAKSFNGLEHVLFHGLFPDSTITNGSICGRFAISHEMLISVDASVESALRSPSSKNVSVLGTLGLVACGLQPDSGSRGFVCGGDGCAGLSAKLAAECTLCHTSFHGVCIPAGAAYQGTRLFCGLPCSPPARRQVPATRQLAPAPSAKLSETKSAGTDGKALAAVIKRADKLEALVNKALNAGNAAAKSVATSAALASSIAPAPTASSSVPTPGPDFSDRAERIMKYNMDKFLESQKSAQSHSENMMAMVTNQNHKRPHTEVEVSEADQRVIDRQASAEIAARAQARVARLVAQQEALNAQFEEEGYGV